MSSASDISAFDHSAEPAPAETLFKDKKWTYIQDASSSTGSYQGQIHFNLSTISSQASFVNWEEAMIELPVKLQITLKNTTTLAANCAPATYDQLVPKAGSWQWIDSCQVIIDGVSVQSNQIKENVNATFKALTETSYNDYIKNGPTSNFVLDEYEPPTSNCPQSLDNLPTASYLNATVGEFGLSNTYMNSGAAKRSHFTAIDPTTASSNGGKLLGDMTGGGGNVQAIAKPQVYVAPVGTSGSLPAGTVLYAAYYLACVKLTDISDYFKKAPMQKNTKGFVYINYNSNTTLMTYNATGVMTPANVKTISSNMNHGTTCPIMWNYASKTGAVITNYSGAITTATGLALPADAQIEITADINGTSIDNVNISTPQSFSRLLVPTYSPNPSADHALSQKKSFRYLERTTNRFVVKPHQPFTWTVSNGIANPKKLFIQPIVVGTVQTGTTETLTPFRSLWTTIPATTSPFASIKNLQITVGNVPIWNSPVSFGYDLFVQEMSKSGADGGLDSITSAGLLSQQLWESLYRFVAVDIGRRLPSEDGATKSIVITGTSNCAYPMAIDYHVWNEVVATVDTSMGTVSQKAVQK